MIAEGKETSATKAGDIMSKDVITCSETVDAIGAAGTMTQEQVRRLPVNDEQGKTVGIVSLGELGDQHQYDHGTTTAGKVTRDVSQPSEPAR
jgi:CBS-domain-containing membrane protein